MPTKPDTARAAQRPTPLVEVRDLSVHFAAAGRDPVAAASAGTPARSRRSTASTWPCGPARSSGWSARAAAASPRWAGRCSAWCRRRRARSTSADQDLADLSRRQLREIRQVRPDGLPGPERRAQPVDDRRGGGGRPAAGARHEVGVGAAHAGRGGPRAGRALAGRAVPEQVPARPVRWAEAAGGDRPGDHPRPRAAGRRRAGLDARHERAGQDPAADARPEAASSG